MKNPLLDIEFLKKLDNQTDHEIYARVIALAFDENPVEEITGVVTGGSINIDGTSAIRRSCSVSMVAQDVNINDFYWGLNTKFKLEIGLKNTVDPTYDDIIWFKQGIFLITSFNTSSNTNSYSISISGKDKMCLLNGDVGGTITSLSVDFGTYDNQDADGNITRYNYPIKEIILEAVHQYAGEPYHNIVVSDLDDQGFELMEYRGDVDMFLLIDEATTEVSNMRFNEESTRNEEYYEMRKITEYNGHYHFVKTGQKVHMTDDNFIYDSALEETDFDHDNVTPTYIQPLTGTEVYTVARVTYGQTCGYRLTDLVYAGDLIGAVGSSITSSLLDKLVQMLGDYEYFYDIDGVFHFQRKRVFINRSWNNIIDSRDGTYVDSAAYTSATTYSFTDSNLISSYQNTPDLANLKNDFAIWGKRKSSSGSEIPIHLRYAIDHKPGYYKAYDGMIYLTEEELIRINQQEDEDAASELTQTVIGGDSAFKITPLPAGLSDEWWEIDDWARRYLYYADIDNTNSMNYYINLSGQELVDIINSSTVPKDPSVHDFNYFCYQLKILQLGNFGKSWGTEDWLAIFPRPSTSAGYYNRIESAVKNNQAYWAYLFDTALYEGKEYIRSVEHGYEVTDGIDAYPDSRPGCSHVFSYALTRKNQGAANYYHTYIYNPEIPDSLKTDTTFIDRVDSDKIPISKQNYTIVDWREIIYQMALDYYKYQHDNNFLSIVAENNRNYYPQGYTGYEQYYIDLQGFWRTLYNPDVQPVNLKTVDPNESYHYYIWDENKEEFSDYTFREATDIDKIDASTNYFYFSGTLKLENLIAQAQRYKDQVEFAKAECEKKKRSLRETDYPSKTEYNAAVARVDAYYKDIITKNNNLYKSIRGDDVLKIKQEDSNGNPIYNYTLANNIVKTIYPDYDVTETAGLWNKYVKYHNYNSSKTYYLYEFVKDLTKLSAKDTYFTSNTNGGYSMYTKKASVRDNTAEPNEVGEYPTIQVPSFDIGRKYYIDEGYEKSSSLEVGNGNSYYSYDTYIHPQDYNGASKYYKRTKHITYNGQDAKTYYNFTEASINSTEYKQTNSDGYIYYIRTREPNPADKTLCKGYCKILQLYANKEYYSRRMVNNKLIIDKPKFFTRGNTYYDKDGNVEFAFERGVVYYLYKGYTEVLDLTTVHPNGYYTILGEEDIAPSQSLALGKVYYGYIPQTEAKNGKYFMRESDGSFKEYNVLVEFKRGSTYYVKEAGYDKLDTYSKTFDSDATFVYDENSGAYTKISKIVQDELGSETKLTKPQMNKLNGKYGLKVTETGTIYGLGQNYDFYVNQVAYRPAQYYSFAFYQKATKFQEGTTYYVLSGADYAQATGVTNLNFYKGTYYTLLTNDDIKVYTTDEYNVSETSGSKYWTLKLKNPELLNFWFDFLDIDDGELEQFAVGNIGDRPKSVNDDNVKAIYYRETPTVIFCGVDGNYTKSFVNSETYEDQKTSLYEKDERGHYQLVNQTLSYSANKDYYRKLAPDDRQPGYTYINLTDTVDNLFSISAQGKSTFTVLNNFLYENAHCAQSITMNAIPIYYLEPNTRVFVHDDRSGIDGQYIVTRLSIPLQYNGTMSISATKAVDRII